MSYATLTDLETRFGSEEINQLSDRDDDGSNDVDVVEGALSEASSEIDSYLGSKYAIPIASPSDNLIRTCCDIARFRLHKDMATDEVEFRYKQSITWLKDLSAGRAVLTDANGALISIGGTTSGGSIKFSSSDRQFTEETMAGF